MWLNSKCEIVLVGCSPNDIVQEQKAIEIKCFFTFRDLDINECCHDHFFMTLRNNKPTLKLNHQYHVQCQGIIDITKLKTIVSVVYTQKVVY